MVLYPVVLDIWHDAQYMIALVVIGVANTGHPEGAAYKIKAI